MEQKDPAHFWYAVNSTEIVQMPARQLETFGTTVFNYYMVSELMDTVDQVRVREGKVQAERPRVLTPTSYARLLLDGFGDEAREFIEWVRSNRRDLRVLQYGFMIKKQEVTEQIYSESVDEVLSRVRRHVDGRDDPLSAIVCGVDKPWEVCILKLLVEIIGNSAPGNVEDLQRRQLFPDHEGVTGATRRRVEEAFRAAAKDPSRINELGSFLQEKNLFAQYEDRFFALLRTAKR